VTDPAAPRAGDETFRDGLRLAWPLFLPTAISGAAFGVFAREAGWGTVAPIVASMVIFGGSAQFASASVLGSGGSIVSTVVAAILVHGRFLAMGVAISPSLRGGRWRRALESQAIVDASMALANRGDGSFSRTRLLGATATQYVAWAGGTVLGSLAGDALGDVETLGIDAVFPAFFLGLLVQELRDRRAVETALLGAALALVLLPLTPPGIPVIAGSAAALLGLRRR
jgi:4-azaleucine resistance transporter AzlC